MTRCPRCGNDTKSDNYVCNFCGKRLRVEKIENFSIFKRVEEDFTSPARWYVLILWLFIKPNRALWNINHKRKNAPGYRIMLFNALLYGLMGLSYFSHINILSIPPLSIDRFYVNLAAFIAFFAFGFMFYLIFGLILIWIFSKGANITVDFSERLESRFGKEGEEKEKYSEAEMSPFSIYKGGTLHQQQAKKNKMLLCAFAPYLLINAVEILIILIGIPNITIPDMLSLDSILSAPYFASPVWTVLYIIDALTIGIWVPILIAISIRELSNSSTFRVLISSLAIGLTVAVIFYFLRPTFII
ncbi:MAG: TFIIB-type zinc ribbon-containing protein [Candidatus Lokiarchaeota archaeon]|nr:TFIIB-type zinc ribbon-containing protein [Candidatus Lokiarchaeota archaeon]